MNIEREDTDGVDLQRRLRELRQDHLPRADLWPGIAARIAAAPAQPADVVPLRPRRSAARFVPWALAASLVLAVGVAWQLRQAPEPASVPDQVASGAARGAAGSHLIGRAADAMTREYEAALRELQASGARAATPDALRQLDRSAAEIRTALARDPDARFLLDRLRRTYEKRLELTQRTVLG